jgi:hypothetical protein
MSVTLLCLSRVTPTHFKDEKPAPEAFRESSTHVYRRFSQGTTGTMAEEPHVSQEAHGSYIAQATNGGQASVHIYTSPPLLDKRESLDRDRMLRRLRRSYQELLDQSLRGLAWVELGLATRADLVSNVTTTNLLFRLPYGEERLLPPVTNILDAYDEAEGELLILGAPGAGKSMLLLDLARALIERAFVDPAHLLPVILRLSSWAVS